MAKTRTASPIADGAAEPKASAARKAAVKAATRPARQGVASKASAQVGKPATKKVAGKAAEPATVPAEKTSAKTAAKAAKPAKTKLVRDSFTIPKDEYQVLDGLKARALGLGHPARKSELLRAGIQALAAMSDRAFLKTVQAVPTLKTGRPKADA